jgi:hypothetical protein
MGGEMVDSASDLFATFRQVSGFAQIRTAKPRRSFPKLVYVKRRTSRILAAAYNPGLMG